MEISRLSQTVPYLAKFFCTIPMAMLLKLENSLLLLKNEQELRTLFYLGRLEARLVIYQLAFGSPGADLFRQRKFFYSTNGLDWKLLPEPSNWSEDWGLIHHEFIGHVNFILKIQLQPGGALVEIRERERLWYVMHAILREAAAVPRGVLSWTSQKKAELNPLFRGLTVPELSVLANYHHFRRPERGAEINLRGRPLDCNLAMDVFDRLEGIVLPEGKSFVPRLNEADCVTTWNSLHWLGMVNFHQANTNMFGFFYSGDGIKNWDLAFMVDL